MFRSLHMTEALTQEIRDCRLWRRRLLVVSFARQKWEEMLSSLAPTCGVTSNAALASH